MKNYKLKFGIVNCEYNNSKTKNTYKVLIKEELNTNYIVKFLDLLYCSNSSENVVYNNSRIISKDKVYDIYEKEVSWFYKFINGY